MEFVVIGDVGGRDTYHVGDEAMLEANLGAMRRLLPGARFTVVSKDPEWTGNHYNVRSVQPLGFPEPGGGNQRLREALLVEAMRTTDPSDKHGAGTSLGDVEQTRSGSQGLEGSGIRNFRGHCHRLLEALRRSSGLIVSGGGNLCSTWPHHICERVALISMAHRLGKPIAVLGQTLGPHLEPREYSLLTSALRVADIVLVRERASYNLVLAMGVEPSRLLLSLDDAFYLEEQSVTDVANSADFTQPPQPWIAVTLAAFLKPQPESAWVQSLADQLGQIRERTGARLAFIPHAGEAKGTFPDQVMGTSLAARLKNGLQVLDLYTAPEVRWLTRQATMIISNRYHPLVFGLASSVPCLGLYSDEYTRVKIQGALAHAELTDWTIPMEKALQGELAPRALQLWGQRDHIRRHLVSKQPGWLKQDELRWCRVLRALGLGVATPEGSITAQPRKPSGS